MGEAGKMDCWSEPGKELIYYCLAWHYTYEPKTYLEGRQAL